MTSSVSTLWGLFLTPISPAIWFCFLVPPGGKMWKLFQNQLIRRGLIRSSMRPGVPVLKEYSLSGVRPVRDSACVICSLNKEAARGLQRETWGSEQNDETKLEGRRSSRFWAHNCVPGVTTVTHQRNDCKPEDVVYLYTASSLARIACCLLTNKNWHVCLQ